MTFYFTRFRSTALLFFMGLVMFGDPFDAGAQTDGFREEIEQQQRKYLEPKADRRTISMTTLFGDLNGDSLADAFVDWCIDATDDDRDAGGGNALMFISCIESGFAVYIRMGSTFRKVTDVSDYDFSEAGFFPFGAERITNGKIICTSSGYAEDDPRCCPSLKGSIYLRLINYKLVKPSQKIVIIR